jgi:hypothetical protein
LLDPEEEEISILSNVGYQSIRRNISGGMNLERYCCKNLKSSTSQLLLAFECLNNTFKKQI